MGFLSLWLFLNSRRLGIVCTELATDERISPQLCKEQFPPCIYYLDAVKNVG
jgi:hypothetical protein